MKFINEHLEEALVVLLLAVMTALVCMQVIMRYVFSASLTWSDEAARYAFIWMTYIGVAYGVKKSAHVSVTVAIDMMPAKAAALLRIVSLLLIGVFAAIVVIEGWALVQKLLRFGQKSASLGIPMAWVYMAPVVGFALAAFRLVQAVWAEIRNFGKNTANDIGHAGGAQ